MNNVENLQLFFRAENERDWIKYSTYLHPDVDWFLNDGEKSQTISGLEAYLEKIKSAYGEGSCSFTCEGVYPSKSGNLVVSILIDDRGGRSIDAFEFEDGLIRREWEFLLG